MNDLQKLREHLTNRIADPQAFLASLPRKARKGVYGKMVSEMQEGDELWEWEWSVIREVRSSFSAGICIVRAGDVIYSVCDTE